MPVAFAASRFHQMISAPRRGRDCHRREETLAMAGRLDEIVQTRRNTQAAKALADPIVEDAGHGAKTPANRSASQIRSHIFRPSPSGAP